MGARHSASEQLCCQRQQVGKVDSDDRDAEFPAASVCNEKVLVRADQEQVIGQGDIVAPGRTSAGILGAATNMPQSAQPVGGRTPAAGTAGGSGDGEQPLPAPRPKAKGGSGGGKRRPPSAKRKPRGEAAVAAPADAQAVSPSAAGPARAPQGDGSRLRSARSPGAANGAAPGVPSGAAGNGDLECPGKAMAKKLTPLQKIAKRKKEEEAKTEEMRLVVDDILAGKFKKEGGQQAQGNMRIHMPSSYERVNTRKLMLEAFRDQYRKIRRTSDADTSRVTEQYSPKEAEGLQIQGGHRPMPRPKNVELPRDFRKSIGAMPLKKLQTFDCESHRMLVSVYGDIFDVSDRPDKYGRDGPYSWMTGNDISWGFVSGKDTPDQVNQFYDMWKIAPPDYRDKKIQGLLAWVAFYEFEYGDAVGHLQEYAKEAGLKGPPMEEAEECVVM